MSHATFTYSGQAWEFIVHHGGYMELQHLDILLDDVRGGPILLISNQLLVRLDNVRQLVRQIILRGETQHYNPHGC